MFGCVLENTIENTFSTSCSHFLTFSQLPNKYIISFLNTETQKKQNPEKIFIKSGHTEKHKRKKTQKKSSSNPIMQRNTKETKPRKKNSSNPVIQKHKRNKTQKKNSSNPVKLREKGRERGDWVRSRGEIARRRQRRDRAAKAKARSCGRGEIEQRWSRSLLDRRGAIGDQHWCGSSDFGVDRRGAIDVGVDLCLIGTGVGRRWCDVVRRNRSVVVELELILRSDLGSLSLSLSLCA